MLRHTELTELDARQGQHVSGSSTEDWQSSAPEALRVPSKRRVASAQRINEIRQDQVQTAAVWLGPTSIWPRGSSSSVSSGVRRKNAVLSRKHERIRVSTSVNASMMRSNTKKSVSSSVPRMSYHHGRANVMRKKCVVTAGNDRVSSDSRKIRLALYNRL